eukprot:2999976-Rhodomonas_salina.2
MSACTGVYIAAKCMGGFAFGAGGVDSALAVGAGAVVPCCCAVALFASIGLGASLYSASNHSSH